MLKRLARPLLPLICLTAFAAAALPATAGAVTVGISDNNVALFSNFYFQRLNITQARDIVVWDAAVLKNKSALNSAKEWVAAAKRDGVNPLITFTSDPSGVHVPSLAQYTTAVRAFMKDVPSVKTYSSWDEPDWIYLPLSHEPSLAAGYFNVMSKYCKGCTILAGDFYLPAGSQLKNYIIDYKRALHYKPKVWALHNYYDVREHNANQLRLLQSLTSGQIWLDEISGVLRRGHWQFKNQSAAAAAKDETYLFTLPKKYHRVTRIYHYQWFGTNPGADTGWDSGVLNPNGTPRPAYNVIAKAAGLRK
jgi:hypothetical protein